MSPSLFAPGFKPQPYWWEAAAPTDAGSLPLPSTVDVTIIGAGYTGLSAALELVRNGQSVAVLEADKFGEGASTRNGGAVSGGINVGKGMAGKGQAENALLTDAAAAYTHVETLIEREGISCNYQRTGRFVGAFVPAHFKMLAGKVARLNEAANANVHMVPRERQREEIGSDYHFGGLVVERAGHLHPGLLYHGMLAACRKAGVVLCAHSRVQEIERRTDGFTVTTGAGRLATGRVIVATNGDTGAATPALRRRLIPITSHVIATEELPEEFIRRLSPKLRAMSDTRRILCYYRPSPDGRRLIFGGRARFTACDPRESGAILHRFMCQRFPEMRGVQITHAWTGNVAFTFDFLPHMGNADGLEYALGCNGSGVAMMTYLGHQTARKILGGGDNICAFDGRPFPTMPLYRGNPWFLPMVGGWYRLRDEVDRWPLKAQG